MKTLFVANRGEPVARAARTCTRLGLKLAGAVCRDEVGCGYVCCLNRVQVLDPLPDLYRRPALMVKSAARLGADAVWPAWGFLSEDPQFAAAVIKAGMTWVGPRPETLALLGDKALTRDAAASAGLPVMAQVRVCKVEEGAKAIRAGIERFPIIVKGAHGGGGKGQVVIRDPGGLEAGLEQALRQNLELFSSSELVAEPFVSPARHVEVQFVRDSSGGFLFVGTRDCTVQRRFQKVIEEAPAPGLRFPEELIAKLRVMLDRVGYVTAGTAEFLFDGDRYHFLEVNPRLQVEHPVSEETTSTPAGRLDLLELMLVAAQGAPLPFTQAQIVTSGTAVEVRVYAEDVTRGNLPETGRLSLAGWPSGEGIRVDTALRTSGEELFSRYDPMLGKIVALGARREDAIDRLCSALDTTSLLGLATNIPLLRSALEDPRFRAGKHDGRLLDRLQVKPNLDRDLFIKAASIALYEEERRKALVPTLDAERGSGLRAPPCQVLLQVELFGTTHTATVRKVTPEWYLCTGPSGSEPVHALLPEPELLVIRRGDGDSAFFNFQVSSDTIEILYRGDYWRARYACGQQKLDVDPHLAPTGGMIRKILVAPGQEVTRGMPLFILETMKMETVIAAAWDGRVEGVACKEGESVERSARIVTVRGAPAPGCQGEERTPGSTVEREGPGIAGGPYGPGTTRVSGPPASAADQVMTVISYFHGYDSEPGEVSRQFESLAPRTRVRLLERAISFVELSEQCASDEHRYSIFYWLRRRGEAMVGKEPARLLRRLALAYGFKEPELFCSRSEPVGRLVTALASIEERRQCIVGLLAATPRWSTRLVDLVSKWYGVLSPLSAPGLRSQLLSLVSEQDPKAYYGLAAPPVAEEYWIEWRDHQALLQSMPRAMRCEFPLSEVPLHGQIEGWFPGFVLKPAVKRRLEGLDVYLVEALRPGAPPRLLAVAKVHPFVPNLPIVTLPPVERAAIECYKLVAREEDGRYQPNHVFIVVDEEVVFGQGADGLSADTCRRLAARVAGFARGLKIDATEVALNFGQGLCLLDVRHAPDIGLVTRPPVPLSARRTENDPERWLDSVQQRMGKLVNRDRAALLFDQGEFEVLHVPGIEGDALDLFLGCCNGREVLAYANDFRRHGGAVGEREGRKLTVAVLYAYFRSLPLIGIHDGAGANVKESVSSLAWAGAYFGAIAATGGFSSPEHFQCWWDGHVYRDQFASMLRSMGIVDFTPRRPLVHIHLHLGASVGMLVYGPSISSLSLMVDHRNVYRVLTGNRAVRRSTGEELPNYLLGGAGVHGSISGDVAMVVRTEEQALRQAAALVEALRPDRPPCDPERVGHTTWSVTSRSACTVEASALIDVLDPDLFCPLRPELEGARNVLTVLSRLGGTPVVVSALATRTGIATAAAWKKLYQALRTAAELRLPFIMATAVRPASVAATDYEIVWQMQEFMRLLASASVPRIAILLEDDLLPDPLLAFFDVTVSAATGRQSGATERFHSTRLASCFLDAWKDAARFLSFIQACGRKPGDAAAEEPDRPIALPERLSVAYDMRALMRSLADSGSLFELWPEDGLPLITALARADGLPVALIADDPEVGGGAQTMEALTKFTRFNRLCERFGLPIVELNDSPAFMPGSSQERKSIQAEGGKSLLEETLTHVPRLAVTLRQNYGGRLIHANLATLGPPRTGIAWSQARMGVMGADGAAVVLLKRKAGAAISQAESEEWKRQYVETRLSPHLAHDAGLLHRLVELPEVRDEIIRWRGLCQPAPSEGAASNTWSTTPADAWPGQPGEATPAPTRPSPCPLL